MATFKAKTKARRFQLLHRKAAIQRAQLYIEPPRQLAYRRRYPARYSFCVKEGNGKPRAGGVISMRGSEVAKSAYRVRNSGSRQQGVVGVGVGVGDGSSEL